MQVTVEIHRKLGWPGPKDLPAHWWQDAGRPGKSPRRPPDARPSAPRQRRPRAQQDPAEIGGESKLPGRASPGPAVGPAGSGRCLGAADRDPTDEDAPTDGRQLLGWSSKQVPDAKGLILSYGKKNGLPSKIVGWSPQQVAAAYRFARGRLPSTTR